MKRLTHALIASAAIGLGAHHAEAATYYVWQGEAVVLTSTAQCSTASGERSKIGNGTVLKTVVRPRNLGSNGNDSRLLFTHDSQSLFAMDLAGGLTISGAGTYAAYGANSSGVLKANVGGNYHAFALTPASPTATTPSLTLTGSIDNFMFITGCSVSFRAGYVLRTL